MDQYTRYYVNQSGGGGGGGGGIGPVYRASFRVQGGNGIGSFLEDFSVLLNPYYIREQRL